MLKWDQDGERRYETGVSNLACYKQNTATGKYDNGFAWSGVTNVTISPEGAEVTDLYADNMQYLQLMSAEKVNATIEAYASPAEFDECDGAAQIAKGVSIRQQTRRRFGLAFKTILGNDIQGDAFGYKLHLLYGCLASPSEQAYDTVNESPEIDPLSWELSTNPVAYAGGKPTALVEINSAEVTDKAGLAKLEAILFGAPEFSAAKTYAVGDWVTHVESDVEKTYECVTAVTTAGAWDSTDWSEVTTGAGPRLPLPDEIATLFTPVAG